jgi:hypothetical protein
MDKEPSGRLRAVEHQCKLELQQAEIRFPSEFDQSVTQNQLPGTRRMGLVVKRIQYQASHEHDNRLQRHLDWLAPEIVKRDGAPLRSECSRRTW